MILKPEIVAAYIALALEVLNHISSRSRLKFVEELRKKHADLSDEEKAKRDYEYEARKRL